MKKVDINPAWVALNELRELADKYYQRGMNNEFRQVRNITMEIVSFIVDSNCAITHDGGPDKIDGAPSDGTIQ